MNGLPNPWINESAQSPAGNSCVPVMAAGAVSPSAPAVNSYELEPFSVHARRRCMDKISPPLPKVERDIESIALSAVRRSLNIHPRDLDLDPPPLFLRNPRPAFLRALFELGGVR